MRILFLGTGSAFAERRFWTSFLVDDTILVDAAPTAAPSLKRCGKDLSAITHIFITHFHGDHTLGLPFLIAEYTFKSPRKKPLLIIGPEKIEEYTLNLVETAFPEMGSELAMNARISFCEVRKEREPCEAGRLPFIAYQMRHFNGHAYGYKIFCDKGVLAFSGDTGPCENLLRLLEGSDVAIIEMSGLSHSNPNHMSMQNILELKAHALPGQKLIVTHMEETEIPPLEGIIISEDLQEYDITIQ